MPFVRQRQSGAVLLLMVLVVLILAGSAGALVMLQQAQQKALPQTTTLNVLSNLEKAMVRFVAANKRLPCAADGRIASGALNAGVESRNANGDCTSVNTGVVPWVTLSLTEAEATDGWGNRLTYRVPTGATGFTRPLAFDMSACATAGTAALSSTIGAQSAVICFVRTYPCPLPAGCTQANLYLANRGIRVNDAAGNPLNNPVANTGAAYVVISAGANFLGAYSSTGTLQPVKGTSTGTAETTNSNNRALQAAYVDAPRNDTATTAHFDDLVLHPSMSTVLTQAQLGPRP